MYERFTDRLRRVLVLADEEARARNCAEVGTDHALLGLLREGKNVGARALLPLGFTLDKLSEYASAAWPTEGHARKPHRPPKSIHLTEALERALREAVLMNSRYIGPEHLLLGLIHYDNKASVSLFGVSGRSSILGDIRRRVLELLAAHRDAEQMRTVDRWRIVVPTHHWFPLPATQLEVHHQAGHDAECAVNGDGSVTFERPEFKWRIRRVPDRERLIGRLAPVITRALIDEGFGAEPRRLRDGSEAIAEAVIRAEWGPLRAGETFGGVGTGGDGGGDG